MSVINKMLQELDRRQGMSAPDGTIPPLQVRAVSPASRNREWFWRIVAALMLAAVGWVGWIAWQLQPRTLVTEQGLRAGENARRSPAAAVAGPVPAPAPAAVARQPAPQPLDTFRLAPSIETPIAGQLEVPAAAPAAPTPAAAPAAPAPAAAPVAPARVEKRDRAHTAPEKAEAEFRRAVTLLNQGRVSEAEDGFSAALAADASNEAARQALVSLHLEHRRIDDARRLLQEGLAINASNVQFATVLARIFVERRDYATALDVLNGARAAGQASAEYHALLGTVLQRLARHADAADAFRAALGIAPQNGALWMGLGISLESLGRRPEAADAFRRALASGSLGEETRRYADLRARQLQ